MVIVLFVYIAITWISMLFIREKQWYVHCIEANYQGIDANGRDSVAIEKPNAKP